MGRVVAGIRAFFIVALASSLGGCWAYRDNSTKNDRSTDGPTDGGYTDPGSRPVTMSLVGTVNGKVPGGALASIEGAKVEISEVGVTLVTDENGKFELAETYYVGGLTMHFHAPGFGSAVRLEVPARSAPTYVNVVLKQAPAPQIVTMPAAEDGTVTVTVGNMSLVFDVGDLALPDGTPATGDVELRLIEYDPIDDFGAYPAPLIARGQNGDLLGLETYGMLSVEATQNGNRLQVMPGQTVDWIVSVHPDLRETASQKIPKSLWLDYDAGVWLPEGESQYDAATGQFRAQLPHFSFWNVDYWFCLDDGSVYDGVNCEESRTDTATCVKVVAMDEMGNVINNAEVNATEGAAYSNAAALDAAASARGWSSADREWFRSCFNYGCYYSYHLPDTVTYTVTINRDTDDEQVRTVTYSPRCGSQYNVGGCDLRQCDIVPVFFDTNPTNSCGQIPDGSAACDPADDATCCGGLHCEDANDACCAPPGIGCVQCSTQTGLVEDMCCGAAVCGPNNVCCMQHGGDCAAGGDGDCCGADVCGTFAGNENRCCTPEGDSCSGGDCCDGYTCDGGVCKGVAGTCPCDDASVCMPGLACLPSEGVPMDGDRSCCCMNNVGETCSDADDANADAECCGAMVCDQIDTDSTAECCYPHGSPCSSDSECCDAYDGSPSPTQCADGVCVPRASF